MGSKRLPSPSSLVKGRGEGYHDCLNKAATAQVCGSPMFTAKRKVETEMGY